MRNRLLAPLLFLPGLLICSTCHADEYHLGQGMPLGENFLLSGYSNLALDAPKGAPASASVDDLSLFVNGRINRWVNPFVEVELSSLTLLQQGNGPRSNGYLITERIYDDARLTESDTLRIGKMLSPVGDWNLIHAAPLVPIATRPLTTYRGFSEYASGVSWLHENSQGDGPNWQLYWQPGHEWLQRPDAIASRHYQDVFGGHVNWSMGLSDKVGLSFQHGQLTETGGNYTMVGINVRKTFGKLMLESEAVSSQRSSDSPLAHNKEWGIYGLADYAFASHLHGVVEWEHYQDHLVDRHSQNTLLGLTYKPEPGIVWKLEYVHQYGESKDIPTGWQASFSVLF